MTIYFAQAEKDERERLEKEIERLKEENWHWLEVGTKLKWSKEANSELLSEIERLKARIKELEDTVSGLELRLSDHECS